MRDHARVQIFLARERHFEKRVRILEAVLALRHREGRHLLALLVVPFEPACIRDRVELPRAAEPVGRGELQRAVGLRARQVLVSAARIVHRAPHQRVFADAREQRVGRLLHCAADIHGAGLDVPREIRQLQHRHHAIDRHDADAVDRGMAGGGQFRIRGETVDVRHLQT